MTKVVEWFGFKLHLLVDVKHEVALSYEITAASAGDGEKLTKLLEQAQAVLPAERIETLAYDKAADSNDVDERVLPGRRGPSSLVYDEAGTVYCYDTVSQAVVRHAMAYIGHEPVRQTLQYRCPARHEGWTCPLSDICNTGKSYGLTVRVNRDIDLRRFPAIPRATKKFERLYKGRTAVERVNARLKIFWGTDDGNLTGSRWFFAKVGVVMADHAAFATILAATPHREGTLGKLNLSPIAKALAKHRVPA